MRFTKHGRDYHLAALLAVAVGLLSGEVLFSALGLAMAFTSAISLLALRARLPAAVEVTAEESRVRLFKGERGSIVLRTPGLLSNWARVEVQSVAFDGPVTTTVAVRGSDEVEVAFVPETAGRYARPEVKVEVRDSVGLFSVPRSVALADLVIDSLPLSLIARPERVYVPPLVVGESPAGTPGKGQEFYGIEEYTQHSESKDILWKRAARAPDRPLLARVREANSPESVRLEIVAGETTPQNRHALVDLECEALGELGRAILLADVEVEVDAPGGTNLVTDDDELADAIMEASVTRLGDAASRERRHVPFILLVVGKVKAEDLEALPRGPTVYIGGDERHVQDPNALDFTGAEPLTGMVTRVLGA